MHQADIYGTIWFFLRLFRNFCVFGGSDVVLVGYFTELLIVIVYCSVTIRRSLIVKVLLVDTDYGTIAQKGEKFRSCCSLKDNRVAAEAR